MFYVSSYDRDKKMYGVTDTEDGAVDFYTKAELVALAKKGYQIGGVSGTKVNIVAMTNQVMSVGFSKIERQVDALVSSWDMDAIMEVARKVHFVRQVKGKSLEEARKIAKTYVYPDSIRDAVSGAQAYTNQIREVDVSNQQAVMDALAKNVCLVLQLKPTNALTSFVCSGGLGVLDFVYAPGFFDAVYLTKQLFSYTMDIAKIRPRQTKPTAPNPDRLNVFSCSLRFRQDGVHHDKGNMVLSTPFYSVNLSRLFCMYILDNPSQLGNTILPEFQRSSHTGTYDFDFNMFQEVMRDVRAGQNSFNSQQNFMRYVDPAQVPAGITITDVMDRYDRDFNYMRKLRRAGVSFVNIPRPEDV